MDFAFNTVLYTGDRLTEAIEEVAATGYDGIELQPHLTRQLVDDPRAVESLAEDLSDNRLRLAAAMIGFLEGNASLEGQKQAAELVARLGGGHLIVLPPQPTRCDWHLFLELLGLLDEYCSRLGVRVAVHHHAGTIVDTPPRIDAFVREAVTDAVGLCYDTAHYALFADDEAMAAFRLAPSIRYVHVKDLHRRAESLPFVPGLRNGQQEFRVAGDGVLGLDSTLRALSDAGYDGWLSVEVENFYRPRRESAESSLAYLREALA